ncbi:putative membrane protein [Propionispora sp. 2/2-37]|uniref:PTS sugar transporter subunit IIC n=1 Tax=Propionispora sp. 2/2-37 TaxID=1677858 RepID=UPI0006BB6FF4|nr:PTS sugar transporter subunit IIC [Propionispora sp. 2/2-37]CUH95952.1 putative membrane protein [Propionispora sp. 2/2-37]
MASFVETFEKMTPAIMKFANAKPIVAMKDGLMITMPLTLVGSIFLLLAFVPLAGWNEWMTGLFGKNWQDPLFQVTGATFDVIAMVGVFGVAYHYAKNENCEPVSSGVLALVSFLIVTASSVATKSGEIVGGVIPKSWTGGKGMIAAILIGITVAYIYSWFIKKKITIKLPEGVPEGVANAFSALIPGTVTITLSFLVYTLFKAMAGKTLIEVIYQVLQMPLQGLTSSLFGAIAIPFLISFFWWFGIHGPAVVMNGVMSPIVGANALANQDILNAGGQLIAGQNAYIVTQQFVDQFITFGGSGMTLGLVVAMIFLAKSQQMQQLGKLSIVPGVFNINEPILFGFPIVLNPLLLIPFILVPTLSGIITYFAIASGFMAPFGAMQVPWTTPPLISGFILGGWQAALLQALLICMAAVIYLPFLRIEDKRHVQEEKQAAQSEQSGAGLTL